ncbi:major surface trophozoite antigen 11-like isoform X2 [Anopheles stephensi]|uniref:major surface trophozoite antigen 11-like isoform X2 n=1 Tax=Anopheles stephensi TaxID=30069 RepID=UPI001658B2A7|nr:major surface trophozoite antigen 11-like isoform X2 [Anopheles stephensi]
MSSYGRIRVPPLALVLAVFCLCSPITVNALECYSCEGEDCVRVTTAGITITCENANDRCFSRYNSITLLPIQRGCLKQTESSTCTGEDCVYCATADLCNDAGSPRHLCAVCSSLADPNCLSNPSSLTPVQCPSPSNVDLTAAQCYSRVIGSVTERACITSQADVDRCTGLDCATCTGSGCNLVEFPTDRIQCVQCDNADSCNTDATSSAYCDDVEDVCVTMRRANGNVMKSCKNAMGSTDLAYCLANPSQCNYCGKKLCNSEAFSASAPTKNCYQCDGSDCLKSSVKLVSCQLTDEDCYSIFSGFNPSRRGCTQELTSAEMAACKVPDCVICNEEECNLVSRADHRCGYCSTIKDSNCVAPATGALTVVQCPAPSTDVSDAQCYTKIIGGSVTERGCISGASDLQGCATDGHNCQTCNIENDGEACNSGLFPSDRRRCTIGTTANAYCPNPWDDCVQLLQSGTRKRTCRSSLTELERSFCANNTNRCHFCSTDNCNVAEVNFNYVECLSCDSATDSRCATDPAALNTFEKCTSCASALITSNGNTTTRRGCLASLPSDVSSQCSATSFGSCQRCSTNRCNVANFPPDRLQCYRCADPPCVSHQNVRLEYCPVYQAGDSCLLESDTSGQLLRLDCRSSLTQSELSACSGRCQMCSTAGCNDPLAYGTSGSCVQCRSSLNSLCRNDALQIAPEPCTNPANSQCYSRLVDGVTERGCMSDLTATERSACTRGENCLVCNSRTSNCNTVQYPVAPLTCFQCDSRTDGESCQAAQTGTPPECPTYDTANKCYTIVQSNGDTVRKCSTQVREVECGTASACEVCLFRGCNTKASSAVGVTEPPVRTTTPGPTNDASTIVGSWTVHIVMLMAVWAVLGKVE